MFRDKFGLKKINVSKSEKIGDGRNKNRTKEHVESKTSGREAKSARQEETWRKIRTETDSMGYRDLRSLAATYLLSEKAVKEIEKDQLETENGHKGTGMRVRDKSNMPSPSSRSSVFTRVRVRYRFSIRAHTGAHRCALSNT